MSNPNKNFRIDYRVIIITLALIATLIVAVILNVNNKSNPPGITEEDLALDNGDEKINWASYETMDIDPSNVTAINKAGVYRLSENTINQPLIIDANNDDVKIILDNATIENPTGPAIACYSANNLVIELIGENYLTDGASYDSIYDEDVSGVIYSKDDLVFQGDGTLHLTAKYQDAIVGKDDLKFRGGYYQIDATDDGIRGKDSVHIVNGNFTISSKADAIKSTNEVDAGKGYVFIEGGNFFIDAGDDGIRASRKLRVDNGTITISQSYEGLESPVIAINGGNISLTTNDDGINAGNGSGDSSTSQNPNNADPSCSLSINGGNIYVNSGGDGVDSNGYIYFNGGTTIIDGPTNNGNGALDSGAGITINGGTVIAVGSNGMAETLGDTSTVYNISVFFQNQLEPNTHIDIKDYNGNTVISHVSAKAFSHLAAGTTDFVLNETYSIYLNDQKYQDFIISGITTTIGNNHNIFNNGFRR